MVENTVWTITPVVATTGLSTTLPKPQLVQEPHCLDHDPCRCTQRACQRPCRVTAAVVQNKGHVSIHVRELHCLDHQEQLSCTKTSTSASTSENCTVWTIISSCRAQQRARQPSTSENCTVRTQHQACTTRSGHPCCPHRQREQKLRNLHSSLHCHDQAPSNPTTLPVN